MQKVVYEKSMKLKDAIEILNVTDEDVNCFVKTSQYSTTDDIKALTGISFQKVTITNEENRVIGSKIVVIFDIKEL